jgi:hypothetical protein
MTPNADYVRWFWRVGGRVGRTIYAQGETGDERGVLIGVMDTPELALDACTHHNNFLYRQGFR